MLHLTDDDVRRCLPWDQLIPEMERALAQFSSGKIVQPLREWITVEEDRKFWGIMPAAGADSMGIKVVSFYPHNAEQRLRTVIGLVLLVNPKTGEPLATLDAAELTARRTAAVSAAITNRLGSAEARVLALLGSGVEAQSHLDALRTVRSYDEVRVWSRTKEHALAFAKHNGAIATDAETAVRGADVIVTATPAQTPILKGEWLKKGSHVNAIGAPMPTWRELDDVAMKNTLVVESRESVMKESGDVILSNATITGEIGEIFSGKKSISSAETTIYKSVGIAIEDVAAAQLAYKKFALGKS